MDLRDSTVAWRRFKRGSGPLHTLTVTVARAIHEERYEGRTWDQDAASDQWLAVGSWQTAEAVVKVLPVMVKA